MSSSLKLYISSHSAILTRITIHPIPDITKYDPDDYTDINKQQETMNKNKGLNDHNSDSLQCTKHLFGE